MTVNSVDGEYETILDGKETLSDIKKKKTLAKHIQFNLLPLILKLKSVLHDIITYSW